MKIVKSVMPEPEGYYERQESRDRIKVAVEVLTLIGVVVYAGLTYCLLKTNQAQIAYSQRTWVGLSEKGISTSQPTFVDGELKIDIGYDVQNFSDSTASKEFDGAVAVTLPSPQQVPEFNGTDINSPCGAEEQRKDRSGTLTTAGDAIFPHGKIARGIHSHTALPPGITTFTNFWTVVCVVYRDQTGGIRHTRLLYQAILNADDKAIQQGLFTYLPIAGWRLWDTHVN